MADAQVFQAAEVEAGVREAHAVGQSGARLIEKPAGLGYGLILTHFKDRAPKPELHQEADDIYYVISGKGTLYLGGTIEEQSERSPGELTGKAITGAQESELNPGDIVSIPRGTPHMVGCPGGELKYFVVKVF